MLVHGGAHTAACWGPLIPYLALPARSVNLPGRASSPGELRRIGHEDFASSLAGAVEESGFERVIIAGHSLAGVALVEVAARIPHRVAHLVFVSAATPPDGKAVIDTASPFLRWLVRYYFQRKGFIPKPNRSAARWLFCNDMDEVGTRLVLDQLCAESVRVLTEPVSRALPASIPRTYVMLLKDRGISVRRQRRYIAYLGGANVLALDAGHDGLVSQPQNLAVLLNGIALTPS